MASLKELREKRAAVFESMKTLRDRANDDEHDWSAEDEQEWTRCNAEYDALTEQTEREERIQTIESSQGGGRGPDADGREELARRTGASELTEQEARGVAFSAWCREQMGIAIDEREESACRQVGLNPRSRELRIDLPGNDLLQRTAGICRETHPRLIRSRMQRELRDLSAVTGGSGGYTVPEGFVNQLEINMLAFGGILQVADVMRTDGGNELPWPTADDTGNTGEQLGESASIGSSVDPTFSQVLFGAYKFSSKLIKVPVELLDDSAFNLPMIIGGMLGERLGRIQNTKGTTGSGAGTWHGLVTASTLGVTAASQTAITADELLDLKHSVDPAYRTDAGWMLHDNILLHIRKLKDGDGHYLFQSNLREGGPDTIDGDPLTINQDMPSSVATTNKTVLYGQFRKYKIRQVRQIRMRRLVERYADADQEGFIAFLRADGNLVDAGTAPVKHLQQA